MSFVKDLTSTRLAIRTGMFLSRHVSARTAERIADAYARLLTYVGGELYRVTRDNQAVVLGLPRDDPTLKGSVRAVLRHAGKTYYDLFRHAALSEPLPISMRPESEAHFLSAARDARGLVVVGCHLSNFDLAIQYLTARGCSLQILTLSEPSSGFRLLNRLRSRPLAEVTPVNTASLRAAVRRLKAGGVVLTGIDRPVPGQMETVEFFGQPARLPTGHIRLALRTNARIMVMWCEWDPVSQYVIHAHPPLEIARRGDVEADVLYNTQRVLRILEQCIGRHPEQWLMFVPVWRT